MLLLDEHSPRIPAAKRRLMVWPLQPRSSTEAFCLKSSHVHICSTPVFKRALLSSEHVRWTLTPLRACPALPYPTLAARGQDKRTPTYPTHKPDPLTPACTFELLLDVSRVKKNVSTLRAHARSACVR